MKNLSDKELMKISGGGFNLAATVGIVAAVSFLVGIFDGIVRPLKCR